jgi:hypothetical protein
VNSGQYWQTSWGRTLTGTWQGIGRSSQRSVRHGARHQEKCLGLHLIQRWGVKRQGRYLVRHLTGAWDSLEPALGVHRDPSSVVHWG